MKEPKLKFLPQLLLIILIELVINLILSLLKI